MKGRKEEKRKRKKKKRRRGRGDQATKVWKLNLCMNFHALMVILLPKSRVLLGFHLNPKFMSSKVGKTPHGTR